MKKRLSAKQAAELIPDGAVIMCGGFLGCGTAHRLMDALAVWESVREGISNGVHALLGILYA